MITIKRWMWMNFAGWVLGIVLVLALSVLFDSLHIEGWQFIVGLGMGLGVGCMQWLALRKAIPVSANWILFTALGLSIPFLIFDLVGNSENHPVNYSFSYILISVFLGCLLIGWLQQNLLKRCGIIIQDWMLANIVGWMLAVGAFSAINFTRGLPWTVIELFALNLGLMLAGGPILGHTTGISLKKTTIINN
ncbi:MAG: hypothetical protein ACO1PI_12020 [Bacteroidota bacterium]